MSAAAQSFRSPLAQALSLTWPVIAGYIPMAVAFGLLFGDVPLAFFAGIWVYAGSAQFLCVKMFEEFALLTEIWVATFFLNLRHLFYGFHLRSRYLKFPFWKRAYCIFALTDETYALLSEERKPTSQQDARFCFTVSLINHTTWVLGCGLGAFLKSQFEIRLKGLDFFLTGLFVVLLTEQIKKHRNWKPVLLAGLIGAAGVASLHPLWLFWAMGLCVVLGLWVFPAKETA